MSQIRLLTDELVRRAWREVADAGPMPGFDHFSEAEYDEHLDAFLRERREGPLHVFAYGSLIWKPVYEPAATRKAGAPGWQRAFCLKVARFRGTVDRPGLMMQLHPGNGSVGGMQHQLDRGREIDDLRTLWRREMTVKPPGKVPRWIDAAPSTSCRRSRRSKRAASRTRTSVSWRIVSPPSSRPAHADGPGTEGAGSPELVRGRHSTLKGRPSPCSRPRRPARPDRRSQA
jgi:ChaC-like protein